MISLTIMEINMRNLIIILMIVLLPGCKLWEWGETYKYEIPKGKHSDLITPMLIEETKVWVGAFVS